MNAQTKWEKLVDTIRFFSEKGWTPATSSNFSFRESEERIVISRSGVDKSRFGLTDLITINNEGKVLKPEGEKASAETLIHCAVYSSFPDINCVLHTHSVNGTVLSRAYSASEKVIFKNFEVLKAFEGVESHEEEIEFPIFPNTQNMEEFHGWMKEYFEKNGRTHGLLIEGHGIYTWAQSIEACKRQIEAFEFLMECELVERKLGGLRD